MTTYGKLVLHLTPTNQQLGRVAMNVTVTEEQWLHIKAILMPSFSGAGGSGGGVGHMLPDGTRCGPGGGVR